jgi:signal transduction histidine kinase
MTNSDRTPRTRGRSAPPPAPRPRVSRKTPPKGPAGHPRIDDAFFRHIVSGIRNGVLAITRDGALALMNEEGYRIFDLTPRPDDLGRPASEVLRERPEIVRLLSGVFDHVLPNRVEVRLRPSNKMIGYTLALVRGDDGETVGAAMFFKDLTRVEQLVERERLRNRLAAVGEMAAVIAHEVKNPLAGIEVMAGVLRRKVPDAPDAQAALTGIINDAKMANAIVQEVLEFVRPIRLQVERTSVAEAVMAAVQHSDTSKRRGSIAVTVNLADNLPQIQADGHQLTQLLTNLLLNAFEAMGGRGRVGINVGTALLNDGQDGRPAVLIEVADDGPGMPKEVAERVFEPFYTTKTQGSGLGLAIVRKIVDAHDGQIDLRTEAGHGTHISVTLPVTGEQVETA